MQTEKTHNYSTFVIWLVVVAAVVGAVFGLWGQQMYSGDFGGHDVGLPNWVGITLGLVLGAGTGWGYALGLVGLMRIAKSRWPIIIGGTVLGIAAGSLCSTVFHAILMSLLQTSNTLPMQIAAIFSGVAGMVLGVIFSLVFAFKYKES